MHDIRPYLPELFNQPGTLLYVGARADAHSWLEELIEAGNKVSILGVWYDNVISIVRSPLYERIEEITEADVREIGEDRDLDIGEFDYSFWWHGPEHVRPSEVEKCLKKLEGITRRLVAVASPWGRYEQGPHAGNPYEVHLWPVYPHDLEWLGYETATDGRMDEPGSEVVGWKRL